MRSSLARGQLHKLIPIIGDLLTTTPVLLQIVEHCLSWVIAASRVIVLLRQEWPLGASLVCTHELSLLWQLNKVILMQKIVTYDCNLIWLLCRLLLFLYLFLFFFFSIEISCSLHLSNSLFLNSYKVIRLISLCTVWSICYGAWLPKFSVLLLISVRTYKAYSIIMKAFKYQCNSPQFSRTQTIHRLQSCSKTSPF